MNTLIKSCFLIALIIYFTGCGKSESSQKTSSLYCADEHEEYTEVCTHSCQGDWIRLIANIEFRFSTEEECLK